LAVARPQRMKPDYLEIYSVWIHRSSQRELSSWAPAMSLKYTISITLMRILLSALPL
jgi:hypothetical protein